MCLFLYHKALLRPLLACLFLLALSLSANADERSAVEILSKVELTGIANGKTVKLGEIVDGRPLFLIFSTAT